MSLHRGIALAEKCDTISSEGDELKAFLIVLRQALLMVVRYIEKRYDLTR